MCPSLIIFFGLVYSQSFSTVNKTEVNIFVQNIVQPIFFRSVKFWKTRTDGLTQICALRKCNKCNLESWTGYWSTNRVSVENWQNLNKIYSLIKGTVAMLIP